MFQQYLAAPAPTPLGLEIVRAEGVYLIDIDGKKYIDLIAGISVSAVGHSHTRVVQAVKDQAEKYMHLMVYGELIQYPQVKLAQMLTAQMPGDGWSVYFVSTGAEAAEGALKLAKRITGRSGLVTFRDSYHGSTHGALSVMGNETFKQAFRPLLPDVQIININDTQSIETITKQTACVILETIQGEAGALVPDKSFMHALRNKCDETRTLLILDEIQCGMGRTGSMFAFEQMGIIPDILLLAKGLGGGMPLGAFVAKKEMMAAFTHQPVLGHITTFGGHPVSCAAAIACLEVILENKLADRALACEKIIRKKLTHPLIKSIDGRGLLLAATFESAEVCTNAIDKCLQNGVFTDWFLFAAHKMRIAPPLTITDNELETAIEIIIKSLDEI